jgi:hypothetical protein
MGRFTYIPDGGEPISDGQTLPVAIRFRLLPLRIRNPANCFVRAHKCKLTRWGVVSRWQRFGLDRLALYVSAILSIVLQRSFLPLYLAGIAFRIIGLRPGREVRDDGGSAYG